SPDGKTPAVGGGWKGRGVGLYGVGTGQGGRRLAGHQHSVNSLAFVPDGTTLVSGSPGGTIRLWDVATGREVRQLEKPEQRGLGGYNRVVLSADGRFAAAACQDQTIRVWELA